MNFLKISLLSFCTALLIMIGLFAFKSANSTTGKGYNYTPNRQDIHIKFLDDIPIKTVSFELENMIREAQLQKHSFIKIDSLIDAFKEKMNERITKLDNENANLYLEDLFNSSKKNLEIEQSVYKKYFNLKLIQAIYQYGTTTNKLNSNVAYGHFE